MRKENFQYVKNEYLIHSSNGICLVEDIGILEISDSPRVYYTLKPFWDKNCRIYVPADNTDIIMRRVMTKKEASEMLATIPSIEAATIENEKKSKETYNELLKANMCHSWVSIIKTIQLRRQERESQGKTLNNIDERYLKKASELLLGELTVSLGISVEEAETCISEKLLVQ